MTLAAYAAIIRDLSASWTPHPAQRKILQAVFGRNAPLIMLESGRKFGKSEIQCYVLWRWALTRPGAYYYFAPYQKQAFEILWKPGRLQTFGPSQYVKKVNEAEGRITFTNGSFIKVDGTDNYEAYRGVNPHGIVLDEFKDSRPEFWVAMEPNLATHKAQALWGGTPPEVEQPFLVALAEESKRSGGYFNFSTYDNPHIDRAWIDRKRDELYMRSEGAVFEREYMARRVHGGPSAIIPMFSRKAHMRPHAEIVAEVLRDLSSMEFVVTCDPGTASVFGVLLSAFNRHVKKVYHLDCLYIERQAETSVSHVIPRIQAMRLEWPIPSDEWLQVYDEAAKWFAVEAAATYGESFVPTSKASAKKEEGLSLIKDQCLHERALLSDRCERLAWEIENYVRDKNGRIPKERDHLIDCWRYSNAAVGFDLADSDPESVWADERVERRGFTIEMDMEEERRQSGAIDFDPTDCSEMETY